MRYIGSILAGMLLVVSAGIAVQAAESGRMAAAVVDPRRAVEAAVIVLIAGGVIFAIRNIKTIKSRMKRNHE